MLLKPRCGFMNTWLINDELAPEKDVTKYNDNHEIVKIAIFSHKRHRKIYSSGAFLSPVASGAPLCYAEATGTAGIYLLETAV